MLNDRRDFLRASAALAGVSALPWLRSSHGSDSTGFPRRFIFIHRGNGLIPSMLAPPTLSAAESALDSKQQELEVDLDQHDLPDWMSPLESHKQHLTILQGLSGKMCTVGHHSWCSSLGVFKANERISSIKWATVDFELARLFPSPLEHIELACFPLDGGNPRGTLDGIAQGFSARGPSQPNYAFGSPALAMKELFKSVSSNEQEQIEYRLQRELLEFSAGREAALEPGLTGIEQLKIVNYLQAIEAVRERDARVDAMADSLRQHVPQLDEKYSSPDLTTLDRQEGHTEVLLAAIISGLTNVVAFTIDELGHHYTGVPGLENEKINMHDVGHGKAIAGVEALEIRRRTQLHHMTLVEKIVSRLKSVPEGEGTLFDNTMIFYFPDGGESHHSHGTEFPFIVLAGDNCLLDLGRRYIRLPFWGEPGHKTLGNWYTTLLNAYGHGIDHFGEIDTALERFSIDQRGPIDRFLA